MQKAVIFQNTLFGHDTIICFKQNEDNFYFYRITQHKLGSYSCQMFSYDYSEFLDFQISIGESFDFDFCPNKHIIEHFENILNGYLRIFKEK